MSGRGESNRVERVTVIIQMGSGEKHELIMAEPTPRGDNPRFVRQQIASALRDLAPTFDRIASIYGDQIPRDEPTVKR
jgi:hypothetical protein